MSSNTPPKPYFSSIDYNSRFFSTISNYLTQTLADNRYLRLIGGYLSGFLGVNRTSAPRVALDVLGQAIINDGNYGIPSNGIYGSASTKLILKEGTVGSTPYALGVDTNSLVYGVSSGANHDFYSGTNKIATIGTSGTLNITTTTNNSITLSNNSSNLYSSMVFTNNNSSNVFMGIGGSSIGNNYAGNAFIQADNALVLNTNATSGTGTSKMIILSNGNVGIGTNNPNSKLEIWNGSIKAINTGGGAILLTPGDSLHNGYVEIYNPSGLRAGYFGYNTTLNSVNYLILACENTYQGLNIQQNLLVNGTIGQGLGNTDLNITTYTGNTSGHINISAVGANANINLGTNGFTRFKVDAGGYNVSMSGAFSSTQASTSPAATGLSGYYLIPIPYLNQTTSYYNFTMLNMYNSDNASFWCGHVIINPLVNQVSYVTSSNSGFFNITLPLVFVNGVWNIKITFSNVFSIGAGNLLYWKYIG